MATLKELKEKLEELTEQLEEAEYDKQMFDPSLYVDEETYDEWLDCEHEPMLVEGVTIYPSTALKECDYTAYRTGFNDWVNVIQPDTIYEYQELLDLIDDLECEIIDVEEEIESLEEDEEED